jgi:mRNA interferase MazF
MSVRKGEIWVVDLKNETIIGSEQNWGFRPCVVVQNNAGNTYSPTVIVACVTTKKQNKNMPTHVKLKKGESGLKYDSVIMTEQLKTVDKERMVNYVGKLNTIKINELNEALRISLSV